MTYADAVTRALRLIGVIGTYESADAAQGAQGLEMLNSMMTGWEGDGIKIGYFPAVDGTQDMNIPTKYERGVIANLAVDMCPVYERQPSAAVIRMAEQGYDTIEVDSVYSQRTQSIISDQPKGDGYIGLSRILTG